VRATALRSVRMTPSTDSSPPATGSSGLRGRVVSGLAWKAATQLVLQGSRTIVSIALARLLLPEEFGLAMMAVVVSSLALIFSDLALGAALIQRKQLSQDDRSTVFWISVTVGSVLTGVGVLLAAPVADFYGEPRVEPLFAAIAPLFLVTALGSTHVALMTREMNFRGLELRLMGATLVGAAVGVVAAALGAGAMAIIAQHLTTAAVSTVLVWLACPWRPSLRVSIQSLRSIGSFSANVFGSRLLFYLSRNADSVLIGRFLGPAALGAYTIAYNIMLVPFSKLAGPVQEVLFPAFARLQDRPERMGEIWLRVNRTVAAVSLPAMTGLVVVAPDFVPVVLGQRWDAAVEPIQILAWVGFLQSLTRLNSSVLQARDRTGLLLRWSLLITGANIVAFAVGLTWGVTGVAAAYAISNTLLQPVNLWLTGRTVGVSLRRFIGSLSHVVQATALMAAAILPVRVILVAESVPAPARLATVVAIGLLTYAVACAWRAPELVDELRILRTRRRSGAPLAARA
jgi:O-antigen/teichoic acid export membrane protein